MRQAFSYPLFTALSLLACGCSSTTTPHASPPYVELSVAKADIVAGESVQLSYRNISGGPLKYGNTLCTVSLEGRGSSDGDWIVLAPADYVCTLELRWLPAGGSESVRFKTSATLPTNTYRLSMESPVPADSSMDDVVYSPTFTIHAAGGP
jgi:hypothetical protein